MGSETAKGVASGDRDTSAANAVSGAGDMSGAGAVLAGGVGDTLWQGRFNVGTAEALRALNDSLAFDCRMFREDIAGSRAHVKMLAKVNLVTDSERDEIVAALAQVESEIAAELAEGRFVPAAGDEDIHTVVERRVTEITSAGAKLHTGRSRNDQVAADLRLWTRNALHDIAGGVLELQRTLLERACEAGDAAMGGYTHLQQAQPVTLAHHLLAHGWALSRDVDRLIEARQRADVSPLGAGALAGSSLPLDPAFTAAELGFGSVFNNSIDAVAARDFVADALYALAMLGVHLSRIGEEIVLWATAEFAFVELDDRYATGSSMMPQKKNPDVAELARAKAGRLIGHLTGLLATLKGLPLAYSKDLQEDKEPLFDAVDTVGLTVAALNGMIATARFNFERMAVAVASPYAAATDLAEWLVARGMPFREAHAVIGDLVRRSLESESKSKSEGSSFAELVAADPRLGTEAAKLLTQGALPSRRITPGSTSPAAMALQIKQFRHRLQKDATRLHPPNKVPPSGDSSDDDASSGDSLDGDVPSGNSLDGDVFSNDSSNKNIFEQLSSRLLRFRRRFKQWRTKLKKRIKRQSSPRTRRRRVQK